MDNLGATFGILISVFLIATIGLRNIILIAAIPSLIAVLVIILLVKERKPEKKKRIPFSLKFFNKNYRLFLFLSSIFALGSFTYSFMLIYSMKFGFTELMIPLLYLTFTLIASLSDIPFGTISDKIG